MPITIGSRSVTTEAREKAKDQATSAFEATPMPDYAGLQESWKDVMLAAIDLWLFKSEQIAIEKYIALQEYRKEQLEKRKAELQKATAQGEPQSMWCADYTLDLSGDVDSIEVIGAPTQVLIGPAGTSALTPGASSRLAKVMAMSPAQSGLAWALLPGWQKWRPTYRVGSIHSIDYDNDTASVTLDEAVSIAQGLKINQTTELTAVDVVYMTCNAAAFEADDRVVVEFPGQLWQRAETEEEAAVTPRVIGFETHPQPCGNLYLRVPEGLLVCGGGLTSFSGPYTFWDPYEREIDVFFIYAPYAIPITDSNNINPFYMDPPPTLEEGVTILEFKIENLEPDYYTRQWSPAYWSSYSSFYEAAIAAGDVANLPTWSFEINREMNILSEQDDFNYIDTVSFGWAYLPSVHSIHSTYTHKETQYMITFKDVIIAETKDVYHHEGLSDDNGGSAWHTLEHALTGEWWEEYIDTPVSETIFAGEYERRQSTYWDGTTLSLMAQVSDLSTKWAVVYKEKYRKITSAWSVDEAWYDTPPGTPQGEYYTEITTSVESYKVVYEDSGGGYAVLDSGAGPGGGSAIAKLYPNVQGQDIFLFGYDDSGKNEIVGVSVGGEVSTTSLFNIKATDGQAWASISAIQQFGVLAGRRVSE